MAEAARIAAAEAEAAKAEAARIAAAEAEAAKAEAARIAATEATAKAEAETVKAEAVEAESAEAEAMESAAADPAAVLSVADVKRYREIFAAQNKRKWRTANKLIKQLEDTRLLGHVLAGRYLKRRGYRASYKQLRLWLAKYGDHPQARKVYKLALKKRPAGGLLPRRPVAKKGTIAKLGYITTPPYRTTKRLTKKQRRRVRKLQARIKRQIGRKQLSSSEKLINGKEVQRLFDQVQIDDATANVAAGWFYRGNYERAAELAGQAAVRSGQKVPLALWMTGLSAWRLEDYATAAQNFEAYAVTPDNSAWYAAAGAYWAARCHQRLGNQDKVRQWLELAAEFPRTFYGIIAGYRLGRPLGFDFAPRPLDEKRSAVLRATPEGERALALLQVGETNAAERELMGLEGWEEPATAEAIMALAEAARLPSLSVRVAKWLIEGDYEGWEEPQLDWAFYPVPPWEPQGGFTVDRALIYAVMRQESLFRRYARSRVGARGLMQLVPSTASSMTKRHRFRGAKRNLLYRPGLNIMLGQRYLAHLMKYRRIQGDLFRVATAYNGGPGNLRSWERRIKSDDDLLFIESLPLRESRMYVEKVMMNLWIYRARLGQPAPTLAAVAADQVATYQALDGKEYPEVTWAKGRAPRGSSSESGSSPWWKFW
jgi:soluble lytic murein transglycosylase-like protein